MIRAPLPLRLTRGDQQAKLFHDPELDFSAHRIVMRVTSGLHSVNSFLKIGLDQIIGK